MHIFIISKGPSINAVSSEGEGGDRFTIKAHLVIWADKGMEGGHKYGKMGQRRLWMTSYIVHCSFIIICTTNNWLIVPSDNHVITMLIFNLHPVCKLHVLNKRPFLVSSKLWSLKLNLNTKWAPAYSLVFYAQYGNWKRNKKWQTTTFVLIQLHDSS